MISQDISVCHSTILHNTWFAPDDGHDWGGLNCRAPDSSVQVQHVSIMSTASCTVRSDRADSDPDGGRRGDDQSRHVPPLWRRLPSLRRTRGGSRREVHERRVSSFCQEHGLVPDYGLGVLPEHQRQGGAGQWRHQPELMRYAPMPKGARTTGTATSCLPTACLSPMPAP